VSEPRCVVDASAVLAWLFKERGEDAVDKVLPFAVLSAVNLAEVLYRAREEGLSSSTLQQDLEGYGVTIEAFDAAEARLVTDVRDLARRANVSLSLADCCCLATAMHRQLPAIGGDQAWEALDLPIELLPFR